MSGLTDLLDKASNFAYLNYSVPKDHPVHNANNAQELSDAIKVQIAPCNVVIVMAGMFSNYSKWIKKEIHIAQNEFLTPKPVLAVEPWATKKASLFVKGRADKVVSWSTSSIVAAVRDLSSPR